MHTRSYLMALMVCGACSTRPITTTTSGPDLAGSASCEASNACDMAVPACSFQCGAGCDSSCTLPAHWAGSCSGGVAFATSGFAWARSASSAATWMQAQTTCQNLSLDGLTGWRLPTVKEWNTIAVGCGGLQVSRCSPCIDQAAFSPSNNAVDHYWTSDTNGGSGTTLQAIVFDTGSGRSFNDDPTDTRPFTCVH
jgi:hypothetical protein